MSNFCSYCKKKPVYAHGLCQTCYSRARHSKLKYGTFDPTYRPKQIRQPVPCPACGRERHYYARGVCRVCWQRGRKKEKLSGRFNPKPAPKTGFSTLARTDSTTLDVLRHLSTVHGVTYRRFKQIGSELARQLGVSRQRIHQILKELHKRNWLSYEVQLAAAALQMVSEVEREKIDKQLTLF